MFCPNCNQKVTEGAFCPSCGTKLNSGTNPTEGTASSDIPATETKSTSSNESVLEKVGILSKIPKKFLLIAVLILAVCIFAATRPTKIKLDNYVTVEFEGYETMGKAKVSYDLDSFFKDYSGKVKVNKSKLKKLFTEEYMGLASEAEINEIVAYTSTESGVMEIMRAFFSGNLDTSSNLSNGDEVTYHWNYSEEDVSEIEDLLNVKLKYSDLTFKVSGLQEIATFNPFDNISVEYSGVSPAGKAEVISNNNDNRYSYLNYSFDKKDNLSNGDQITVTVSISGSEENFVEMHGAIPSPTEQTYTVEGLLSYITKTADIPQDLLAQMQKQSEDHIKSYVAKNWAEEVSLKELSYLGNYFLLSKTGNNTVNKCYLVYKLTAEQNMETKNDGLVVECVDSYYYVGFSNLMTEADGTGAVDIASYDSPWESFRYETDYRSASGWYNLGYTYKGYENLELLYNKVVTQNLENFTHEDNVTEEKNL